MRKLIFFYILVITSLSTDSYKNTTDAENVTKLNEQTTSDTGEYYSIILFRGIMSRTSYEGKQCQNYKPLLI